MEKRFLTVVEVANLLNVSISWVKFHSSPAAKDRLPVVWIGGLKRFDPNAVLQWVRNANETPTPQGRS